MKRYAFNALHLIFLLLSLPWIAYRRWRWGKNRRGWSHKLMGWVPRREGDATCIWFHAVSVGEVNLLLPVVERLKTLNPNWELVFSTTTETGYEVATAKFPQHTVFFWPYDFSWAVGNALDRIQPNLIVLAELELWPNFIELASRYRSERFSQGIPVAVINGRLSESSFRGYQRFGWLIRPIFSKLSLVAAQDSTYASRFVQLGCPNQRVLVTGNIKYDGVQTDRSNRASEQCRQLANIQAGEFVFVAGSTQEAEDLLAAEVYRQLKAEFPQLRLILVPRHPERSARLMSLLTAKGFSVVRRSEIGTRGQFADFRIPASKRLDGNPDHTAESASPSASTAASNVSSVAVYDCPILIVDVVGELNAWWGLADAAFVGGSMGTRGGQNMLEPAAYAAAVCFGPNTKNFTQVVTQLLGAGGAVVVHDQAQLQQFVQRVMTDAEWAKALGQRAQQAILQHHGAADQTVQQLLRLLKT